MIGREWVRPARLLAMFVSAGAMAGCGDAAPNAPDGGSTDAGAMTSMDGGGDSGLGDSGTPADAGQRTLDAGPVGLEAEAAEYLNRAVIAYCRHEVGCGTYGVDEDCWKDALPYFMERARALDRGSFRFDAARFETCRQVWEDGDVCFAARTLTLSRAGRRLIDCGLFGAELDGQLAEGESCHLAGECAAPNHCDVPAFQCARATCQAGPVPSREGGSCDGAFRCVAGAICSGGICVALKSDGQSCTTSSECEWPLDCELSGGERVCSQRPLRGEACDRAPCASLADHCDPATRTCRARPSAGEACGSDISCLSHADCVRGSCIAKPGIGERCPESVGCRPGTCTNGVCAPLPLGECRPD